MESAAITRPVLIDADAVPPVPDQQRVCAPSFLRRLEAPTERIKHPETENTRLREALAHALGEERALAVAIARHARKETCRDRRPLLTLPSSTLSSTHIPLGTSLIISSAQDNHRGRAVAVVHPDAGILAGRGPLVALLFQKRARLGLDRSLQQQPRTEPGHLLNRSHPILAACEHPSISACHRCPGDSLLNADVGSSFTLAGLRRNLHLNTLTPPGDTTWPVTVRLLTSCA